MPQLTLRLSLDPETGRPFLAVGLLSDEDALPHEHEQQHRLLVERLLEGGTRQAEEAGRVTVRRDAPLLPPVLGDG